MKTGGGGGGGGGGNFLGDLIGSIGSIFSGGSSNNSRSSPSTSGSSSGGGILSGITKAVGSIFGGGSSSGGGGILETIGGGIKSLFSGFFANGGMIPQGRFGIAGEAGPELIGGPASVTPMGTNVTYNINAVDAASFKAMIARDPSFLFAVSEQGRRSLPGGR
jgi:hypothetical protein